MLETVDNFVKIADKVAVAVDNSVVAVDKVVAEAAVGEVDTLVLDTHVSVDIHSLLDPHETEGTAGSWVVNEVGSEASVSD